MAANLNIVVLAGNITKDVELRHTGSGTAVTEVTLAINNRYKGADGNWVEEPVFVDCTVWGRQAEVLNEYCRKGTPITIEGRLKLDTWEDKNTGQNRQKLRVNATRMQMNGDSQRPMESNSPAPAQGAQPVNSNDDYTF